MLISIALLFLLSPLSSLQTPTSLKRNTTGTSLPNSAATTGVTLSLPKPLIVAASTTTTGNAKQKSQSAPSSVPKSGPAANNNNAPSSLPKTSSGAAVIKLNQTTSSSSSSSSSSPLPSKPNAAPVAAKAVKDNKAGAAAAPSSPHPIKVVITDGCLQKEQKTDANSSSGGVGGGVPVAGMAPNKELTLKPGSPLVMTHHISLVPSTCTGGCEAEMAALKGRVEYLEKEMAAMKKMCTSCSATSGTCPNGCSGQGRCEEGKCVCNAGHSGADCSTQQACPANCNKRGKCVKGKCVCNAGFSGMDCGKGSEKKVKVTVETVTMKVTPEMNTIKETTMTTVQKTKVDKTIFVKTTDKDQKKVLVGKEADVQGQTKGKTAGKPGVSLKTDTLTKVTIKPAANATKTGGKVTKTVGQVFLKQSARRPEQATKGKTEVKKIDTKAKESSVKKVQLKDQPLVNVTQTSVKKMNGTSSKVLTQLVKVSKPTVNVTASEKTTMRKSVKTTTGTQAATGSVKVIIKTGTVKQTVLTDTTSTDKEKKPIQANATVVLKEGSTLKRTESQLNGTTVETKIHTKQTDKTSLKPANTAMTVSVQNITSSSFILSWETSQSVFRNFTLTRRELAAGADWEQEVVAEEEAEKAKLSEKQDVSITTATSSNMTEVVKHTSADTTTTVTKAHVASATKSEGKNVRKFTQVLPGTARSFQFRNLRPQTRYALTLFGTAPGFRSKIYRLTVTTGPEPPSEILFTNVTESSVTVSWTKPKSTVTGFKVIYTNVGTGASGSLSMESQLSMVVISKLSAGTSYEISVTSVLEASESDALRATVVTAPDTPTVLQAVNVTDTKALLVWKPTQAKVDRYILSYGSSKSPNVTVTVMLSGSTVEHHLRGLHRSTLYTVTLVSQLNSLQSAPVTTTFTTATGVKVQAVAPNMVTSHSAVIAWKAPHVAFKTYRLTYQVLGQETKEVLLSPTVIQYELTGLKPGSNYTVKVEGEKEGSYITVVSTEFLTGGIPFHYPKDCSEVQRNGMVESGEAEIFPEGPEGEPVLAYCDMETDGGGWTVFQRRAHGKTDFFRGWKDYSKGFGFLSDEFWLGNDHIHTLTSRSPMTLRVDLRSGNDTAYAHYANFSIGSEESNYTIHVSGYSGNSGDSMRYHSGRPFSTKDRDPHPLSIHCAKAYMGGWWYKNCYKANLNGLYATFSDNQGVVWIDWKGKDVSIPFTEMKLRPASFLAVAQG